MSERLFTWRTKEGVQQGTIINAIVKDGKTVIVVLGMDGKIHEFDAKTVKAV